MKTFQIPLVELAICCAFAVVACSLTAVGIPENQRRTVSQQWTETRFDMMFDGISVDKGVVAGTLSFR